MAKATKKRKQYKSTKGILRAALKYFKANSENWTHGQLRRKRAAADDGIAFCVLGACSYFAEQRKLGNVAVRYPAEAMGMPNAHKARLSEVEQFVYRRNDGKGGKKKVMLGLEKAVA
jgi:hypothetical protein